MTNFENINRWNEYIETTQYIGKPVKLDKILQLRMKAFVKARELTLSEVNL